MIRIGIVGYGIEKYEEIYGKKLEYTTEEKDVI